jgi:hypothetical protein
MDFVQQIKNSESSNIIYVVLRITNLLGSGVVFMFLGYLFGFHLYITSLNVTTIEYKHVRDIEKYSRGSICRNY